MESGILSQKMRGHPVIVKRVVGVGRKPGKLVVCNNKSTINKLYRNEKR